MTGQPGPSSRHAPEDLRLVLYRSLGELPGFGPFLRELAARLNADTGTVAFLTRHGNRTEVVTVQVPDGIGYTPVDASDSHTCSITITANPDLDVSLIIRILDKSAPPFTPEDQAVLESLREDFTYASRLFVKYAAAERERRIYRKTLDKLGIGLLLLDSSSRLLAANGLGEELLRSKGALQLVQGNVKLNTPAASRSLMHAIERATQSQVDPQAQHGEPVLLTEPGQAPALTGFVFPGPQPHIYQPMLRTAVVLITEPGRKSGIAIEDIMPLFGLTRAEAALAIQLADGETVATAAVNLGISRNTARVQLNAIFQKTGAVRQSELVRMILKSAATCVLDGRDSSLGPATGGHLTLER